MPKKPNITAKIAPDVLLQEFKSEEFFFSISKFHFFGNTCPTQNQIQ